MEKIIERIVVGLAMVSGFALLLVMTIMFCDVIGRYVFNSPLTFAVELIELLMGLAICFGLALTTYQREHIRVDLLTHARSAIFRRVLDILADIASILFFALIAWKLFQKANQTLSDGLFTQILSMPVFPVVYLMSLASLAALLAAIFLFFRPAAKSE